MAFQYWANMKMLCGAVLMLFKIMLNKFIHHGAIQYNTIQYRHLYSALTCIETCITALYKNKKSIIK